VAVVVSFSPFFFLKKIKIKKFLISISKNLKTYNEKKEEKHK
jgi:hypothetical protein